MESNLSSVVALILAGVAGASFAWPMKHFRGWRWEHVWTGQALTSNFVFPLVTLACVWPVVGAYMSGVPARRYVALFLMGAAWGVGGLGYGMSIVLLGLSFTYSVVFSVTTVCGALLPFWISSRVRPVHLGSFFIGLLCCVLGTLAMARAAARRDREVLTAAGRSSVLPMPVPAMSYASALAVALVAGVFSAAMGLALAQGEDLVNGLAVRGASAVIAPLVVWIPVYAGSTVVALSYGLCCVARSKCAASFVRPHAFWNWTLVNGMGVLGFGAVLLYGFGASAQGHLPKNVAWAVYMTSFILCGNCLGVAIDEWKNCSRRTYSEFAGGVVLLVAAIGYLARS